MNPAFFSRKIVGSDWHGETFAIASSTLRPDLDSWPLVLRSLRSGREHVGMMVHENEQFSSTAVEGHGDLASSSILGIAGIGIWFVEVLTLNPKAKYTYKVPSTLHKP